jgi:hypothetical protein
MFRQNRAVLSWTPQADRPFYCFDGYYWNWFDFDSIVDEAIES